MRKLLRRIARYKMKLEGVQHMNKPHGGSYFHVVGATTSKEV